MSDIVNRLREKCWHRDSDCRDFPCPRCRQCFEAADEIEQLRTQLAAAEAECDIYKSRCICELAHDDDEAEHECGWQVCGICWNNACAAHKQVADQLQAQLAAAHALLREACERWQIGDASWPSGAQRVWKRFALSTDWYERAKKEVGDE